MNLIDTITRDLRELAIMRALEHFTVQDIAELGGWK